jgi:hypothetical protein
MLILLVLGLLILAAAAAAGTVGFLDNRGSDHQLATGFAAFGHTMHGSTGQLFVWGLVVGSAAMFGLMLFAIGVRGERRHRRAVRPSRVKTIDVPVARYATEDSNQAPQATREIPKTEPAPVPENSEA